LRIALAAASTFPPRQVDVGEANVCPMVKLGGRDAARFEVAPEGAVLGREAVWHGELSRLARNESRFSCEPRASRGSVVTGDYGPPARRLQALARPRCQRCRIGGYDESWCCRRNAHTKIPTNTTPTVVRLAAMSGAPSVQRRGRRAPKPNSQTRPSRILFGHPCVPGSERRSKASTIPVTGNRTASTCMTRAKSKDAANGAIRSRPVVAVTTRIQRQREVIVPPTTAGTRPNEVRLSCGRRWSQVQPSDHRVRPLPAVRCKRVLGSTLSAALE
jgi:hypothetical protein